MSALYCAHTHTHTPTRTHTHTRTHSCYGGLNSAVRVSVLSLWVTLRAGCPRCSAVPTIITAHQTPFQHAPPPPPPSPSLPLSPSLSPTISLFQYGLCLFCWLIVCTLTLLPLHLHLQSSLASTQRSSPFLFPPLPHSSVPCPSSSLVLPLCVQPITSSGHDTHWTTHPQ